MNGCFWRAASLLAAVFGTTAAAHAEPFAFTLSGYLYGSALGVGMTTTGTPIPDGTPFTETASFDTSSPNLVDIPGLAIYVPSHAAITFGGTTYQIAPFSDALPTGVAVAIFDKNSPFPAAPEYAVALIGNPILEGAGILADFTTATPDFTIDHLVTTNFPASGFVGAGFGGGTCVDPSDPNCGSPYVTQVDNVEPFQLTAGGHAYSLILPNEENLNYALNDPNAAPENVAVVVDITTPFTASLTDVPEPAALPVLMAALAACLMLRLGCAGRSDAASRRPHRPGRALFGRLTATHRRRCG